MTPEQQMLELAKTAEKMLVVAATHHEAIQAMTKTMNIIMANQNDLNNRTVAIEEWSDHLTEANNNIVKRVNSMEARQDPSKHNNVVGIGEGKP